MNLSLQELEALLKPRGLSHSYQLGKKYFIRGVTMYYVGCLVSITDTDLVLEEASWVVSSGRLNDTLRTGRLEEVEPFVHPVIVPRGSVVDATEWVHPLPKEVINE